MGVSGCVDKGCGRGMCSGQQMWNGQVGKWTKGCVWTGEGCAQRVDGEMWVGEGGVHLSAQPPRWPLKWAVCILLYYIIVVFKLNE